MKNENLSNYYFRVKTEILDKVKIEAKRTNRTIAGMLVEMIETYFKSKAV